jgi:cytochrome P450
MSLPPGPESPPLFQTLHFGLRSYDFAAECGRRFGDAFTLRLLGLPPMVMFRRPEAIREIFELGTGSGSGLLGPLLGSRSLFELDDEGHARTRRLLMPPFRGQRMHLYGRLMQEIADASMDGWAVGRRLRAHSALQSIALDVILSAVFGLDEPALRARLRLRLLRFLSLFDNPATSAVMLPALQVDLGRFSPWGRVRRRIRDVDALLLQEIRRRREQGRRGREDVLSQLIFARDPHGDALSDAELRDQMFTLLLAGHETTATAMAWVLHRVLRRPDVLAKLRDELGALAGREPCEEVGRLAYLDAVVKETLRLNPVIPEAGRRLGEARRVGGIELPAGSMPTASIYLAHRRPESWPDPDRFEPERFLGLRPSPFEFLPFGGGVRRCAGAAFASYEMKIVLARILSRARLRVAPGYRARVVRRAIACSPSRGLPVVVEALGPRLDRSAREPAGRAAPAAA